MPILPLLGLQHHCSWPNQGRKKFRFTVDLRPVNKFTMKHQYPMPNLEHELSRLTGKKHFATLTFRMGTGSYHYTQTSQELQSFLTPEGVYTPTRVLHGTTNAVTYLQSSLCSNYPTGACFNAFALAGRYPCTR